MSFRIFTTSIHAYLGNRHARMLLRLLKEIERFRQTRHRDPYTRETLRIVRTWGHGHKIIKLAEKLGLIERYEGYIKRAGKRIKCIYNTITEKGRKFIQIFTAEEENNEEEPP